MLFLLDAMVRRSSVETWKRLSDFCFCSVILTLTHTNTHSATDSGGIEQIKTSNQQRETTQQKKKWNKRLCCQSVNANEMVEMESMAFIYVFFFLSDSLFIVCIGSQFAYRCENILSTQFAFSHLLYRLTAHQWRCVWNVCLFVVGGGGSSCILSISPS